MMRASLSVFYRFFICACLVPGLAFGQRTDTRPDAGIGEHKIQDFLLTNARVILEPGVVLERASIWIEDGKILQVGSEIKPREGLRVIDMSGKSIYPGWIDLGLETDLPEFTNNRGTPHWNPEITPQRSVAGTAESVSNLQALRRAGITTALFAPKDGIIKGTSALAMTADASLASNLLRGDIAMHVRLTVSRGRGSGSYPSSPMGAVALARQTFLDTQWYDAASRAYRAAADLPKPEADSALEAIHAHITASKLFIFDTLNEQYALRADSFAKEFGLKAILKGSGQEYQLLDLVSKTGRTIILPVNFPKPPNVATLEAALDAELEELMHWEIAPENPARLDRAGIPFVLTSSGLNEPSELLVQVRTAIQRGLDPNRALAALTSKPAELMGVADQIGKIRPGYWANFIVANGDIWDDKTKIEEVWVKGNRPANSYKNDKEIDGLWDIAILDTRSISEPTKPPFESLKLSIKDSAKKISASIIFPPAQASAEDTKATENPSDKDDDKADDKVEGESKKEESKKATPQDIKLVSPRWSDLTFSAKVPAKQFGKDTTGVAQLSVALIGTEENQQRLVGTIQLPDGSEWILRGTKSAPSNPSALEESNKDGKKQKDKEDGDKGSAKGDSEGKAKKDTTIHSTSRYPFASFGMESMPEQVEALVIQNTTLWTAGPAGILRDADMIVRRGRIEAIGIDLPVPEGAVVIDGSKFEVSPGLIDCHSHMATDSGVNEGTQAVTAEVRIGDFINAEDVTIYRQLAGGLTAANVLHGSANPIGGQNQVIKLRWGRPYEELKFQNAPAGVKFALGENVKQSNWTDANRTRYPQSRMGVEQLFRDRFNAARDYEKAWKDWNASPKGLPPRRDLELDALVEILRGQRWIHCHSYRQDEILALIRVCDDYGITIGSLQHILEGYKVAEAIAKHGATASSFSDWWAYKFEVYDAIPHNGALMHQQGIVVSFNSDDAELGRHMNHEAAKAVKYGGVDPHSALQFVTLNPAKQLRIDKHVGSLEVGKDADFVLWNGSPLSVRSRCEQTWIDGRKYFDRQIDAQLRLRDAQIHRKLVQKVLDSGESPGDRGPLADDPSRLWPNHDEYCHHHHDENTNGMQDHWDHDHQHEDH
jgi:N-acetylglucosamine-6-phosphate deacetylase